MDEQNSRRWLETINRERRTKDAWKEKYLTKEELQRLREEQDALAREEAEKPVAPSKLSEREGMLKRLAEYEVSPEEEAAAAARPMTTYEAARLRVAQQVDATRPRSHRMTQDLSTPSLLRDVGPGLWISINPGYVHANKRVFTSSQHAMHIYDPAKGWADKVDKTHHLHPTPAKMFADKCLQLGEKPFLSGGMKLTGK